MEKRDRHGHKKLTLFTLRIMGEIGGIIAAPVVLLTWLARRANLILELEELAKPKLMAISLLVSFVISTVALCIRAAEYGEQYEVLTDDTVDAETPDGGGEGTGHLPTAATVEGGLGRFARAERRNIILNGTTATLNIPFLVDRSLKAQWTQKQSRS